jgi:phytol kinase
LIMFAVAICLLGTFLILVIAEVLAARKVLKGEYLRKFVHIAAGSFIAFWPWLISWHWLQMLGLAMLVVTAANHYVSYLSYHDHRASFGDIFLALAVFLTAILTDNQVFFCLAILEVALADGLAALAGIKYGKNWRYKVLGHPKTVIGSMVFWIVSLIIFGFGLLPAHDAITYHSYFLLLLIMPPVLTVVENISIFGLDNLIIPLVTIAVLRSFQT